MKKMIFGLLLAVPMFSAGSASALPGFPASQPLLRDVIEVRGGHGGHGHGHGWGRGHGHRAFGWSRGRKVGWRGYHCPPGLWKQGRC
jgi:hypothetical protein